MFRTTAPFTIAQYEALMAPPVERITSTQLFDYQDRCYADAGIAIIENRSILRAYLPEDGKPFLVVPSKPQIATKADLDVLIAKLTYKGKHGANYLDPQYLADEVVVPTGAYLIADIDDGRAMLNVAPRLARVRLAKTHRSPFTWWEGYCLHLCFGFAILGHHNVDCSRSRFYSEYVPSFCLSDGKPRFYKFWDDHANPRWGSASCGSRVPQRRQAVGDGFEDVVAYAMTPKGIDLRKIEELEGKFGTNAGRGCDVKRGPCSCGAWH